MGRYIPGDVDEALNLSTLAAGTLISAVFDNTVNERTLISSVDAIYSLSGYTPAAGDGPIMVGLAHSDYSDAEIQAVIDATLSWNEGDLIAQEVAKRRVRRVGIFDTPADATQTVSLNDGKKIKTKLNWIMTQQQTLRLWAMNMGSSALATTNPLVLCEGKANLWPK